MYKNNLLILNLFFMFTFFNIIFIYLFSLFSTFLIFSKFWRTKYKINIYVFQKGKMVLKVGSVALTQKIIYHMYPLNACDIFFPNRGG